jgi:hypothetical protein
VGRSVQNTFDWKFGMLLNIAVPYDRLINKCTILLISYRSGFKIVGRNGKKKPINF